MPDHLDLIPNGWVEMIRGTPIDWRQFAFISPMIALPISRGIPLGQKFFRQAHRLSVSGFRPEPRYCMRNSGCVIAVWDTLLAEAEAALGPRR